MGLAVSDSTTLCHEPHLSFASTNQASPFSYLLGLGYTSLPIA